MSVKNTCVDWLRGVEPHEDPAMRGKKDPDEGFFIKVPRRNVGPSTTQVKPFSLTFSEVFKWSLSSGQFLKGEILSFEDIILVYLVGWLFLGLTAL